jgi:hypothetical protein
MDDLATTSDDKNVSPENEGMDKKIEKSERGIMGGIKVMN